MNVNATSGIPAQTLEPRDDQREVRRDGRGLDPMSRLRSQEGFTLMEMLVAATVGFVILSATLGLLESTLRLDNGVMAKTDAQQRGRLAMDRITQELRSQVCLNLTTPAILPVKSTADSVTFYSDFGENVKAPPMLRTITFDAASGNIIESDVAGAGPDGGPFTYTATPTKADHLPERHARGRGRQYRACRS